MEHLSRAVNYYTCTVGKKPSEAANFVADVDAVHEQVEEAADDQIDDLKVHQNEN